MAGRHLDLGGIPSVALLRGENPVAVRRESCEVDVVLFSIRPLSRAEFRFGRTLAPVGAALRLSTPVVFVGTNMSGV